MTSQENDLTRTIEINWSKINECMKGNFNSRHSRINSYNDVYFAPIRRSRRDIHSPKRPEKKAVIIVHPSKEEFKYGNCAAVAICSAFSVPFTALKLINSLIKLDIRDGLSFFECKKVINMLAKVNNMLETEYTPNHTNVTFKQMLTLFNRGKYITMFSRHISYSENGEIYDSYFQEGSMEEYENSIPTGWWRIS